MTMSAFIAETVRLQRDVLRAPEMAVEYMSKLNY